MHSTDFNIYPLTGWYPGHMLKAGRKMQEALKLIDLLVELVDARAPLATRNPWLQTLPLHRPHLLLANKADLADGAVSRAWEEHFREQQTRIFFLDSRRITQVQSLIQLWKQMVLEERSARGATRPLLRPVRIMIVGVPNVGKSTLVNRLHEKKRVLVGPQPGVTRQNQWVPLQGGVELLDTPGVLWPKIADKGHELLLTALGNIKDEITGLNMTAEFLILKLREIAGTAPFEKLDLPETPALPAEFLAVLARRRGLLLPGGHPDNERAAAALLKEFRRGRLGRYTLQLPQD